MSIAKRERERRRQLGQWFTPEHVARAVVDRLPLRAESFVLEPSFGDGSFVFEALRRVAELGADPHVWARARLFGTELDRAAHAACRERWSERCRGPFPAALQQGDFFRWSPPHGRAFDLIVGNPPFGGTLDRDIEDALDARYGNRFGHKIKKETYAFFIVRCVELLAPGGTLCFVCSDTLLTINTMRGLRHFLQRTCDVTIERVPSGFEDTAQPLILLTARRRDAGRARVRAFGVALAPQAIAATPNLSWRIDRELARYFTGPLLGDVMVATSGMTTGNNALFLRRIDRGCIAEPYAFRYEREPVTLAKELARARLGKLSARTVARVADAETRGDVELTVRWRRRARPRTVRLPHADYRPYNKADGTVLYAPPTTAIYWADGGNVVYTYKRNGKWYLHGVGGRPFFEREGLTWPLVANRFKTRYLPPGYILDSGAPCAFVRDGVDPDELYFVIGWTLTPIANTILKSVLNHTRNIQSKDFERMPYPAWVSRAAKSAIVALVRDAIASAMRGEHVDDHAVVRALERLFTNPERLALGA